MLLAVVLDLKPDSGDVKKTPPNNSLQLLSTTTLPLTEEDGKRI